MWKKSFILLMFLNSFAVAATPSKSDNAGTIIDSFPIISGQRHLLKSQVLNDKRYIDVSLPENYHLASNKQNYPVMVVLDGQFMFNSVSGVVKHLSSVDRMPESIIVSLPSPEGKRYDYSPNLYVNGSLNWGDTGKVEFGDKHEKLIGFFKQELFPFIDSRYRTVKFRTLVGLSPTSAFTLHTLWKEPELFQAHIAIAAGDILRLAYEPNITVADKIKNYLTANPNRKTFLYVSSADQDLNDDPNIQNYLANFQNQIIQLNTKNIHLKTELIVDETHYGIVMHSLLSAMKAFYPVEKWSADYRELVAKKGNALKNIDQYYANLTSEYGFTIRPKGNRFHNVNNLNWIGHKLIKDGRLPEAVEVFNRWIELYPNEPLAHRGLSEALEASEKYYGAVYAQEIALSVAIKRGGNDISLFKTRLSMLKEKL